MELSIQQENLLNNRDYSDKLSSKYQQKPTMDVIKPFIERGFTISAVKQSKRGKASKFGPHIVRLRHPDVKINDDFIELVVANSYDGTQKLSISLGIFRMICTNGLVIGDYFSRFVRKHIGAEFHAESDTATYSALDNVNRLKETVTAMRARRLTEGERTSFASAAYSILGKQVNSYDALSIERSEDASNDLYTTLNVVQEHIMNGGTRVIRNGVSRRTRGLSAPKTVLEVNRQLFDLACAYLTQEATSGGIIPTAF